MRKLTTKEEKFCNAVVKGAGITEAYRAVYDCSRMKPATVNRMAKTVRDRPKIDARIEKSLEKARKSSELTEEYVIRGLMEVHKKCTVTPEDENDAKGFRFDASGANKSLELLGKRLKLFTDKVDHSNQDGTLQTNELTDIERAARIIALFGAK